MSKRYIPIRKRIREEERKSMKRRKPGKEEIEVNLFLPGKESILVNQLKGETNK